jgi:hypothetical protein
VLRQKFTDEERRVSRCVVVVQLHDLQVKLSIDCLTTWNKLIINEALPIKIKKRATTPSHLIDSGVLSLVAVMIFPPIAMIELLFRYCTRTPTFHHLLRHFSESFHQHLNDETAPN